MKNFIARFHKLYFDLSLLLFEMAVTVSCIFRLQSCNCVIPFSQSSAPFWYIYDNFLINNIFAYITLLLAVVVLFISSRPIKKNQQICIIILFVQMFTFFYAKQYNLDSITLFPYLTDFYGFGIEALLLALIYKFWFKNDEYTADNKHFALYHLLFSFIFIAISVGIFYLFNY